MCGRSPQLLREPKRAKQVTPGAGGKDRDGGRLVQIEVQENIDRKVDRAVAPDEGKVGLPLGSGRLEGFFRFGRGAGHHHVDFD